MELQRLNPTQEATVALYAHLRCPDASEQMVESVVQEASHSAMEAQPEEMEALNTRRKIHFAMKRSVLLIRQLNRMEDA